MSILLPIFGLLLVLACIGGVIWLIIASVFYEGATVVIPTGCCPSCNYNLEGLPAPGTCPECGLAYRAASRSVRKLRVVPERFPIVAGVILLSFLSFAALAALPYPVALVAYRLTTDWSFSDCKFHAGRAPTFDGDFFILILALQTWFLCVIAVRIRFRIAARLVLFITLGGVLGMLARLPTPIAWSQGMFIYFERNTTPPRDYTIGALIGTMIWLGIYFKSLSVKRPQAARTDESPPHPPQSDV